MVLSRGRRQPLPDRRYLVADRNRRHFDHAAAGRDQAQAGFGDAAVLRRGARDRRRRRQGAGRRNIRQSLHRQVMAGDDAHGLWRSRPFRADLFLDLQGQIFHRRRLPSRRRRLLLDHRPRRRCHQRVGSSHGHRRSREFAGGACQGVRGGRGRLSPRHQGPGHLCLCDPDGRHRTD